jgi:hypothetical protein
MVEGGDAKEIESDENENKSTCGTKGCLRRADLACPTCIKLGLNPTKFCSQECFKNSWNEHKILHKQVKKQKEENKYLDDPTSMPADFKGFSFTGNLRPCQKSPRRQVPEHIPRPDYGDHRDVNYHFLHITRVYENFKIVLHRVYHYLNNKTEEKIQL